MRLIPFYLPQKYYLTGLQFFFDQFSKLNLRYMLFPLNRIQHENVPPNSFYSKVTTTAHKNASCALNQFYKKLAH